LKLEFGSVRAAILALALALSASAEAHDVDCHGMAVSEAKKLGCCGAGDAHFGVAWQFYEDRDGFWHYLVAGEDFRLVRGVPENMNKIEPLPSMDGCYTVSFRVWNNSGIFVPGEIRHGMSPDEVRFYCLEIPMLL
jgi:hypothetical protein